MDKLEQAAHEIGSQIVRCSDRCENASANVTIGILPRGLFFEKRSGNSGAVIVGLNPGTSRSKEHQFYIERGATYPAVVDFVRQNNQKIPYYSRLRRLVDGLDIDGSLWWTDLAKCECADDKDLPIQSLRYCGGRFLHRELEAVPKEWPVLAIGRQAYHALPFLLPDRIVLGFPHPTGSRGQFSRLFNNGVLNKNTYQLVHECLAASAPQACWFTV